jgi:small subunit ribosomal protein S6
MNHYETVFILTPVLPDDQVKDAVAKFKQVLIDKGATIVHEEHWGLKKLAYPIKLKNAGVKNTGFYTVVEFTADNATVASLETEYRRDERVMRFLTVALDKHAVAYAEKRRRRLSGQSTTTTEA